MKIKELSREIYNTINTIKKPFDQREAVETLQWVIRMVEDGLDWQTIRQHLEEGCNCPQVKSKEELEKIEKGGY